jgi:hypothetical protein
MAAPPGARQGIWLRASAVDLENSHLADEDWPSGPREEPLPAPGAGEPVRSPQPAKNRGTT